MGINHQFVLLLRLSFEGSVRSDPKKVLEDSLRRKIQDEELDALMEKLSNGREQLRSGEQDMVIVGEVDAQPIELNFLPLELERVGKEPLTGDRIREVLAPALVSDDLVGRNAVIADMLSRLTPENAADALGSLRRCHPLITLITITVFSFMHGPKSTELRLSIT